MDKPLVKELKWVIEDLEEDTGKDVYRPNIRRVKKISLPQSPRSKVVMTPVVPIAPGELGSPGISGDEEATDGKEKPSSVRNRHEQARAMADAFTEEFHSVVEYLGEIKNLRRSFIRRPSLFYPTANENGSPLVSAPSEKALRQSCFSQRIRTTNGDIIQTCSASSAPPNIPNFVKKSRESKAELSRDDAKKMSKSKVKQGFHHLTKCLTGLLNTKNDHAGDQPIAQIVRPSVYKIKDNKK
ncbi:uncharacterized protein LOC105020865 [Esox lucius]|uniref:uncharacterized protein LOC105020865 n=1 Tax=Esox lucius TaxID=8010 RepID=UPI0009733702|nr:uncharacterized protein LOC105020865 [Esox lucius]